MEESASKVKVAKEQILESVVMPQDLKEVEGKLAKKFVVKEDLSISALKYQHITDENGLKWQPNFKLEQKIKTAKAWELSFSVTIESRDNGMGEKNLIWISKVG